MSRVAALLAAIVLPIALLFAGLYVGAHPSGLPDPVQDILGVNQQQEVVSEATDDIKKVYYRKIGNDALADASIAGMVKSLNDRFSNYFTPKQYADFKQQTSGQFSGVGMTVTPTSKGLKVVSTYPKSGAREAGLRQGDVVIAANGTPLGGKNETVATGLVKGPPGSTVVLTWIHHGKKVTKRVRRATVSVPVVSSRLAMCNGTKVAVVRLATFSSGAHAQVYAALRKQIKRGAKAVVLDLRANGGGLVTEAQLVASAFLKDGDIVTTRGRDVPSRTLSATGDVIVPADAPVVVLVDGGTASASEIVAGALQDRKRATLVGADTFGKGVFQEILNLSNGGALDITAGQYFLPSGRNIGGVGVKRGKGLVPTVKAPADDTAKKAAAGERLAVCTAAKKV